VHRRTPDGRWHATTVRHGEVVDLTSVGVAFSVDDVYRDGLEDADAFA
jgi:hypothetical protein